MKKTAILIVITLALGSRLFGQQTISIGTISSCAPGNVCIPVTAGNFTGANALGAFSLYVQVSNVAGVIDPASITISNINPQLSGNNGMLGFNWMSAQSQIGISWWSGGSVAATIPGGTLFEICFAYFGGSANVTFNSSIPYKSEVYDFVNLSLIPVTYSGGSLNQSPLPGAAVAISGPATVCQGQTGVVYTVGAISNATSYNWTLPPNATITAGAGTNCITVSISSTALSGAISVRGVNSCGYGPDGPQKNIVVNPAGQVNDPIDQVVTAWNISTAVSFTTTNTGGITTYTWTNNTPSIGLPYSGIGNIPPFTAANLGSVPIIATITVSPHFTNNSLTCIGSAQTFTITVNPAPQLAQCKFDTLEICSGQIEIPVRVSNLINLDSLRLSLVYDTNTMEYIGFSHLNSALSSDFYVFNNFPNNIYMMYFGVNPISLINDTLLCLKFNYSGGSSILDWNTIDCKFYNTIGQVIPTNFINGIIAPSQSPIAFSLVSGSYSCTGGLGVNVGLSGSQVGVTYTLYVNNVAGISLAGTGAPLNFGYQTETGIYTVIAYDTAVGCNLTMNGVAVVTLVQLPAIYNVLGGGSCCIGCSHLYVILDGSQSGIRYELYINGQNTGVYKNGNGSPFNYEYATLAGDYTIKAVNIVSGCWAWMNSSATVVFYPTAQANIAGGGTICLGQSSTVTVTFTDGTGPYSFGLNVDGLTTMYTNISGNPYTFLVTPGIYPSSTHNYTLAWVCDIYGCYNDITTGNAIIQVSQPPTVSVPQFQPVCLSSSLFNLSGGVPPGGTYFVDGTIDTLIHPETAGIGQHSVTYQYIDTNGCISEAYSSIQVIICDSLFVSMPTIDACIGEVDYPIILRNLNNASSISLSVFYDSFNIEYLGYSDLNPGLNSGMLLVNSLNNKINVGWFSISPINIEDDTLIALKLLIPSGTYNLTWDLLSPGACYFTDMVGNPIPAQYSNGSIHAFGCSTIQGNLTYNNTNSTPLSNCLINLIGNNTTRTVNTNSAGHFEFNQVENGNYYLIPSCTKPWGGVNSIDALLILKHFVYIITLSDFRKKAADVDGTGFLNSSDALIVTRRFVQLINSFVVGDWLTERDTLIVNGTSTITSNLKAICFGDVDGSYIPAAKLEPEVFLVEEGEQAITTLDKVEIPFRINQQADIGAVSLILNIDQNIAKLQNVKMNQEGELLYNVIENEVRISWYSLIPLQLTAGDVLFSLGMELNPEALHSINSEWISIDAGSQIGDADGIVLRGLTLSRPHLNLNQNTAWLGQNIPNPFNGYTTIPFYIPLKAMARLVVTDMLGQKVFTTEKQQYEAGNQEINIKFDLMPGVYIYELEINGLREDIYLTRRMIVE